MAKILIVEDNQGTNKAICEYMKEAGHTLFSAFTGSEALKIFREKELDIIVLDIMLPEMSGIVVLHEIRKVSNIPVIMLTALDDEYTQSNSFDEMADDYITKPFNPLELIARVNSNIRRYTKLGAMSEKKSEKKENVYQTGELILDDETKKVTSEGKEIKLTATEFKILKFLMKNKGKVYSIPEIYENVWKEESYGAENIIAVHIRHIREKIEINPKEPKYLKVIWGIGYKIEDIK